MRSADLATPSVGVEVSILFTVIVAVSSLFVPLLDHYIAGGRFTLPVYQPSQCNPWNPYDCRFWEELPPAEFGES